MNFVIISRIGIEKVKWRYCEEADFSPSFGGDNAYCLWAS